jgi:curli biogenesis system outer membrane secretion channel CsgG
VPIATATRKAIVATSRPIAVATPIPAAAPKAPAADPAASVVRSYLNALAHGDRATASTYLAGGSASETFMSGEAQIESIRSTPQGNSSYLVTADVKSGGVEYYATFTVAPGPGGLQITDHYWIKPQ